MPAVQKSASGLARRFGVAPAAIYQWNAHYPVIARSPDAHRLQTALSPTHAAVVVHLRSTMSLMLDDLPEFAQDFLCAAVLQLSPNQCLWLLSVCNLKELKPAP